MMCEANFSQYICRQSLATANGEREEMTLSREYGLWVYVHVGSADTEG